MYKLISLTFIFTVPSRSLYIHQTVLKYIILSRVNGVDILPYAVLGIN